MKNYRISIDLLKVKGAFVTNLQGHSASKRCVCIPVEEAGLYDGKKGCYLNGVAFETTTSRFGDTHYIKTDIPREAREAMTEEQRRALPIIGNMRPLEQHAQAAAQSTTIVTTATTEVNDLPF